MDNLSSRTEMLIGNDGVERLKHARVLLCGVGGVGGYCLEALLRAGVGEIGILDNDTFSPSNLNRQILATVATIGRKKTEVAFERAMSINPNSKIKIYDMFYLPENADSVNLHDYDYIIDAIDTVTAKLELISRAKASDVPVISCMGTGNKIYTDFVVADIAETSVCPLCKVMRKELKARGVEKLKVVFSKETPLTPICAVAENGRHLPGSISYAPAVAGLILAGEVIRDLLK
ncbi:MAG: tRNA threonylcarbamoyladenosine dehydratase [Clostridia bacterium]